MDREWSTKCEIVLVVLLEVKTQAGEAEACDVEQTSSSYMLMQPCNCECFATESSVQYAFPERGSFSLWW